MTDEAKALVERSVELAVNATCIADEHADVLRPKQIERLYAMRDLIETQAREIERLREALRFYADENNPYPNEGPWGVGSTDFGNIARAALGASHD